MMVRCLKVQLKVYSRTKLTKIAGAKSFSCLAVGGANIDLFAFIGFIIFFSEI